MKTPESFKVRPMLPFPFSNGEDFIQVDWTGTMSVAEGMQGYLAYWYKTGRVLNIWRKQAPIVRIGFLIEGPDGLEFPASGEQSFDPTRGVLESQVRFSESVVLVESFLCGPIWVQAVRFLHAAPGTRLCFTANHRVSFRLATETPLSSIPEYFTDDDGIVFRYGNEPDLSTPPNVDFIPAFRGTGRLVAWSSHGQIPTSELHVPCHHLLNLPNGGLWFAARTDATYAAFAVIQDNLSECGEQHASRSRELLDVARRKGLAQLRVEQEAFWRDYQAQSAIRLEDSVETTYFIEASLYGIKSALHARGAIPCSLFLPALSGATFWDSWGMASGLLRMNHPDDAKRIGRFLVRCLPKAREYAKQLGAEGARLEWDLWPPPFDGMCPRAPRVQIHNSGTHLNTLWDAYSFTGDIEFLKEVFPVIEETVQFYLSYAVIQTSNEARIRPVQSLDENPALRENDTWTLAVIIRSLEILRTASVALELPHVTHYLEVEEKLRERLKLNYQGQVLKSHDNCRWINLGSILPFRLFEDLKGSEETLNAYCNASAEAEGLGMGPYTHARARIFPWVHGMVASAMNRQGLPDIWRRVLAKVPKYTDHLGGAAELWLHSRQISYPWYLGSHGFFLSNLAELIGMKRSGRFCILDRMPAEWRNLTFKNIRMDNGLLVSGSVRDCYLEQLTLKNDSTYPHKGLPVVVGDEESVVAELHPDHEVSLKPKALQRLYENVSTPSHISSL